MRLKKTLKKYYKHEIEKQKIPECTIAIQEEMTFKKDGNRNQCLIQYAFYTTACVLFLIFIYLSIYLTSPLAEHMTKIGSEYKVNKKYNQYIEQLITYLDKSKIFKK